MKTGRCFSLFLALAAALPMYPHSAHARIEVTEVMYHTPAEDDVGVDPGEFIEIHNRGDVDIPLDGHGFDNGVTYDFPAGIVLRSGAYLVVAANPSWLEEQAEISGVLGPFAGSLSNGGEGIRLVDGSGETVVSFRYGDHGDWPAAADGAGHSIVMNDPTDDPDDGRNWSASRFIGGSPGKIDDPSSTGVRSVELIGFGHDGFYFEGWSEPSGGTTAWTEPEFQTDNEWFPGPGGYGYSTNSGEQSYLGTQVPDMRNNFISLYARQEFFLTQQDVDEITELLLTVTHDDGAVIYLNGTPVFTDNIAGSPPSFQQSAGSAGEPETTTIDIRAFADRLVVGNNVLAMQVHNANEGSSDCLILAELDATFVPPVVVDDERRFIEINEILAASGLAPDWIELFNPTATDIDLGGAHLSDDASDLAKFTLPAGTTVPAGGFLVISQDAFTFGLATAGEKIFLTEPAAGYVLTSYGFGPQTLDVAMARFPDGGNNWYFNPALTPGEPNTRQRTGDIVINEIMYHAPDGQSLDYIELKNVGAATVDISGWQFRGVEFEFDADTLVAPGGFVVVMDNADAGAAHYGLSIDAIAGSFGGSLSNAGERLSLMNADDIVIDTVRFNDKAPWPFTADGYGASLERSCISDAFDNPDEWRASPLDAPSPGGENDLLDCTPPVPQPIVISEFLYHSSTGQRDERDLEFIELHNRSDAQVSLNGWSLLGDAWVTLQTSATIPAGGFHVLARNPEAIIEEFGLSTGQISGPFDGTLPNGGGFVMLIGPDGRYADHVDYDDDWPWMSKADGGGRPHLPGFSLERLCMDAGPEDIANWTPSAPSGPTPGAANVASGCDLPPTVVDLDVEPRLVLPTDMPMIAATLNHAEATDVVELSWFIDDPEVSGEPIETIVMSALPSTDGEATSEWTATMPQLPANSIVRYAITVHRSGVQQSITPDPDRDEFAWHGYFVDPLVSSQHPVYHLFISSQDWASLHTSTAPGRVSGNTANPNWNNEVSAIFVADGVVHDVMVRHQGSRWNRTNGSTIFFPCESHQPGQAQVRSWRIDFPSYRNHDGKDVLILQKQSGWPNQIAFRMFQLAGVPAPDSRWANLRINGCDFNPDAFQIERPGTDLAKRWFGEVGDLFKSQGFTGNEGPWSWGDERLISGNMNGYSEQERYETTYNRKTRQWMNNPLDGKEDFVQPLIEELNLARTRSPQVLRQFLDDNFDVDLTLRYICTINYVGNFDDMFQNHYLYRKTDGKWCMFPWDMDNMLGTSGDSAWDNNPFRGADQNRINASAELSQRIGFIDNRSGWWNRIKDSFFIAYEKEFLEMFLALNNSVFSPEAMAPVVAESAALRGASSNQAQSIMNHIGLRHGHLNNFIAPLLDAPEPILHLSLDGDEVRLTWPGSAFSYQLQATNDLGLPWQNVVEGIETFEGGFSVVADVDDGPLFFRLMP